MVNSVLEGLTSIPWNDLKSAYGDSDKVPDYLGQLVSATTQAERTEAWDELWESAHHQFSVYEVTPFVIPFLMRILGHTELSKHLIGEGDETTRLSGEIIYFISTCLSPHDAYFHELIAPRLDLIRQFENDPNPETLAHAKAILSALGEC